MVTNKKMVLSPGVFERVEPGARKANKRHLMACALACFDELGLEGATIENIRDRAGSSIGSIYHHFGNKDGLVAALYFAALDDQLALMQPAMANAASARQAIEALVTSYLEWVTLQPQLAHFMFRARHMVAAGPHAGGLQDRNKRRYGKLLEWLMQGVQAGLIRELPRETYASLLIGQSENYCRAWLSGRVKKRPAAYAGVFAEAAWRSVGAA